ncbi:MAG: hypothetical protein J6A63_08920 [Clostridia bacterium]|nr:hypothetical protein [Clostridia bacterium]
MAKKKNPLSCPSCMTKLMEVAGHCEGVIIVCPQCNASILADIDRNGRMRLSVEPLQNDQEIATTQRTAI